MPVTKHRYDKKSYETNLESKLSGTKYVTKPENRVGAPPHTHSVAQAEKIVSKLGSGK